MFTIKNLFGRVLFQFETDSVKVALQAAVGARANLYGANLRGANLYGADLYGANLYGANLYGANLRGANLYGADLYGANLYEANLRGANLYGANLYGANLRGANLYGANLRGANLRGANLYGADLYGANLNDETKLPAFSLVPDKGDPCIGWKRLRGAFIAKLRIPEDADRTSTPMGRKNRTNKAEVVSIFDEEGNQMPEGFIGESLHDSAFKYPVGQTVEEPNYNGDFREECTSGIHFFITRKEAEEY